MSRLLSRSSFQNTIFYLGIAITLFALISYPAQSVEAARSGVTLCGNVILPSLLPFFILSSLCVELGLIEALGRVLRPIMVPLFRVNGSCIGAFLLGIVGGYPVGARTAISLYQAGQCSKTEAERMLSFCNNSGPAFILGVVGAGIFSSSQAGLLLYGTHVLASILVGLCFRFYGTSGTTVPAARSTLRDSRSYAAIFTDCVKSAFTATLNICAFVIFFTVLIRLAFLIRLIPALAAILSHLLSGAGVDSSTAESLLTGLIEMTSGVWSLRSMAGSLGKHLSMAAFILGWAGLSVHCQVLSFIGSSGLSTRTYFFGKLLHGVFSAVLTLLFTRLLHFDLTLPAYLATEVSTLAGLRFANALLVSSGTAITIWLVLAGIFRIVGKDYGKSKGSRV